MSKEWKIQIRILESTGLDDLGEAQWAVTHKEERLFWTKEWALELFTVLRTALGWK